MASDAFQKLGLSSNYVLHVANQLAEQGVDVAQWLSQQRVSLAQLQATDHLIPWQALAPLFRRAEAMTGDRSLGLKVGQRLRINTHGVVGFAAMNSRTVRCLVNLFERFVPLRINMVTVHHQEDDEGMRICVDEVVPLGQNKALLISAVIAALYNIIDFITSGSNYVRRVNFSFPAICDDDFARSLFRCDVQFEQSWSGLYLPHSVLDQPLKSADPQIFKQAEALCERELARMQADTSCAGRLRRVLLAHQPHFVSLKAAATLLHMTPRTLHRRLLAEGVTFQQILDDVRQHLAEECLRNSTVAIETLAYALGYSDASNFRRAFRRWTGWSPSVYRQRQTKSSH